jgi:hypothetical protein
LSANLFIVGLLLVIPVEAWRRAGIQDYTHVDRPGCPLSRA